MTLYLKKSIYAIALVATLLLLIACASVGSKTLYNSGDIDIQQVQTIYVYEPEQENFDFYSHRAVEEYYHIIKNEFATFNIQIIQGDSLHISFDSVTDKINPELKQPNSDLVLLCKIKEQKAFGQTTDFRSEYKFLDSTNGKLLYQSKFSTTFGKTTVGLPSEEELMRSAIKSGLHNFKKDYLR